MHLMDKLEQVQSPVSRSFAREADPEKKSKADHQDNDAIVDDLAGQAYVEQFGTETFSRAENAMKLNKATRYDFSKRHVVGEDR